MSTDGLSMGSFGKSIKDACDHHEAVLDENNRLKRRIDELKRILASERWNARVVPTKSKGKLENAN